MKVLVPVKRVVDYNIRVRVKADGSAVDLADLRMSLNPFDEIALEAALRLKEGGLAGEVLAVSCGPAACQETLRTALAMGADRALLVETDVELQPLAVARVLHAVCAREAPGLVLCGKQAIDDDAGQTGQMLAALLGWPQATCVSELQLVEGRIRATREIDGGQEILETRLPAVVTADLRLNEPRYTSLPNIIKARKKPLDSTCPAALGVAVAPRLQTLGVSEPARRRAGVKVQDVAELLEKLRQEAGVLR